jgi:hypothetical protein
MVTRLSNHIRGVLKTFGMLPRSVRRHLKSFSVIECNSQGITHTSRKWHLVPLERPHRSYINPIGVMLTVAVNDCTCTPSRHMGSEFVLRDASGNRGASKKRNWNRQGI